jgi:hypothetical protein
MSQNLSAVHNVIKHAEEDLRNARFLLTGLAKKCNELALDLEESGFGMVKSKQREQLINEALEQLYEIPHILYFVNKVFEERGDDLFELSIEGATKQGA